MAKQPLLTDANSVLYEGAYDPVGHQFVAKQAGTVTTDSAGTASAPQAVSVAQLTDDPNGYAQVTLGTRIAGEDITNDVLKAEAQYTYNNISTNTTTTVKSGPGFLHALAVNNPGASETVTLYDNTTNSGTLIATITIPAGYLGTILYDVKLTTGLTIVTAGTTACNLTVSYR